MKKHYKNFKLSVEKEINEISKEVPVYFISGREMKKKQQKDKYVDVINTRNSDGMFVISAENPRSKLPYIYLWIRKRYNYVLPWFLFHEYGHFICYNKYCRCIDEKNNNFDSYLLCEYHADMYALKRIIELSSKMSNENAYFMLLAVTMFIEDEISVDNHLSEIHQLALLKSSKSKRYSKLIRLRNDFYRKLLKRKA